MLKSFSLSSYSSGKWVLNTSDRNILINDNTATLLKILEGSENYKEAHQKFQLEFCLVIPFEDFQKLINQKLGGYNIIKDDSVEERQKLQTQFFRFKTELLNAKQVGVIARPFVFLFNPQIFRYVFVGLIFLLLQSFFVFQPLLPEHYGQINLILLSIVILPNICFHELGHIAACRQFGIKHGGMGFGVYWILPILYADVNNIWMVDKNKRIIINTGGVFHQIVYSSILLLAFIIYKNYTILYASYFVAFTGLLQFNPFIRLDGYWILSDLTETPNLLTRANVLLKKFFTISFLINFLQKPILATKKVNKSSLLIFTYGLINYLFMLLFFSWSFYRYYEETLYFPVILYKLFVKIVTLQIEITDFKYHYVSIVIWYALLWSLLGIVYRKLTTLFVTK